MPFMKITIGFLAFRQAFIAFSAPTVTVPLAPITTSAPPHARMASLNSPSKS